MQFKQLAILLVIATATGGLAQAKSLKETLQKGVSAVEKGASNVAKSVDETVDSTVDLMKKDEDPDETRQKIDQMAASTLSRLFLEQPKSKPLFDDSVGYAVFDTRKVVLAGVAAGAGRGVAISKDDTERVYMQMGTAGLGLSFGIGGFETQIVVLFKDMDQFQGFVTNGYDATAQAGTMVGKDSADVGVGWINGRAVFYLTKEGWKVSATVAGTKYWPDKKLNEPDLTQ